MGVPKQKVSKGRRNRRRSHHALGVIEFIKCKNCGQPQIPHTVCTVCDKYTT